MRHKKKKGFYVWFSSFTIFFVCCSCMNLLSKEKEGDFNRISQMDVKTGITIIELENEKSNIENNYYHSVSGEKNEEKKHSDSLTEQIAYLEDQSIKNEYYHSISDEREEEKECSDSLTEQIAYLEDQSIKDKYYHSINGEREEEKECSDSLTEQIAYLEDQNINETSSNK